jgi:hypothetical protein
MARNPGREEGERPFDRDTPAESQQRHEPETPGFFVTSRACQPGIRRTLVRWLTAMPTIPGVYDGKTIGPLEGFRARPNTRVIITFLEDERQDPAFPPTRIEDVAGCLAYSGPTKTIAEMNEAVLRHARDRRR